MLYTNNNKLIQILTTRKGAGMSVAGATIVMIVIMLVFAIMPAYSSITDQLKNNEAKVVYLTELKNKQTTMEELSEEYSLNENLINKYNRYMNSDYNTEVVLANLNQIGINHNSVLATAAFADAVSPVDPGLLEYLNLLEVPLNLSYVGTIPNLSQVLSDIEKYPVPINISAISFSHFKGTDGSMDADELISIDPRFTLQITASYFIWGAQQ
jgi:hypothetical protein